MKRPFLFVRTTFEPLLSGQSSAVSVRALSALAWRPRLGSYDCGLNPVVLAEMVQDDEENDDQSEIDALLGVSTPLRGCELGAPQVHVLEPDADDGESGASPSSSRGTVVLLHGSAADDWLGVGAEPDSGWRPRLGGIAEQALAFRAAG